MFLFFKPVAKAEVRTICPHCERINEEEIHFPSTDRKVIKEIVCKNCLKKFMLEANLVCLLNIMPVKEISA